MFSMHKSSQKTVSMNVVDAHQTDTGIVCHSSNESQGFTDVDILQPGQNNAGYNTIPQNSVNFVKSTILVCTPLKSQ